MRFSCALLAICILGCGIGAAAATHAPAQPSALPAPGWGLPQLMQGLAEVKSATANFTERKTMAVLDAPLVVSGTLSYIAPDWMQKDTLLPVPERFVLSGRQVTMSGGADHQTHIFSLDDDPLIGGLTEGILATLAGNLPGLERVYDVQLTGSQADWQLLLRPKDARLSQMIRWMRIRGSLNRIEAIDTQSGNGDHSEMHVDEKFGNAN